MEKTISIIIAETKQKIINVFNDSQLPLSIVNEIIQNLATEINAQAKIELENDLKKYNEVINNKSNEENVASEEK